VPLPLVEATAANQQSLGSHALFVQFRQEKFPSQVCPTTTSEAMYSSHPRSRLYHSLLVFQSSQLDIPSLCQHHGNHNFDISHGRMQPFDAVAAGGEGSQRPYVGIL
jgi:hypothetical protein